ncbi:DUF2771 domain-containing protein [Streptomyces sp. NPDC001941]|uniref:DUF2771 domain-containing protein n=1 Tax=Streptomyces sp. NPDC001941 TaxID=3154659 RepID=UPI0033314366
MTVAYFSGKRRRAAAALGAVSAGLLVLSACDKPTPVATLTVGSDSVNTEASCYGKQLGQAELSKCLNGKDAKTVKVDVDKTLRFGVDPKIADAGWLLFVNGQQAEQAPIKKTYRELPASSFFSEQIGSNGKTTKIAIVSGSGKSTGIWQFTLEKDS